ncbi:MAG: hypothetical protein Q8Q30_03260 [Candidatus Woesebacteria bacterium]|nr:hypothetical protein [Candidatus Woesebacteria bacterium]
MIERRDNLPRITPPFFEFPKNPKIFELDCHPVYEYIQPHVMDKIIEQFSWQVNLNWFDKIVVNLKGGEYFAKSLAKLKNYQGEIINIEYHRDRKITIPVPSYLRDKRIGVIDDILDGGGTAEDILNDAPNASFIFLTKKIGIQDQIIIPRSLVALQISDVWVGGCGMNLESDGDGLPENFTRKYKGLVAKIMS